MCQMLRFLICWALCAAAAAPASAAAFRANVPTRLAPLAPTALPSPAPGTISAPLSLPAAAPALKLPVLAPAHPAVAAPRKAGRRFARAARVVAAAGKGGLSRLRRDPSGAGHGRVLSAVFDNAGRSASEGPAPAPETFSIGPAVDGDVDAIARIAHDVAVGEQRKSADGYRHTGFTKVATLEEHRAYYARMMAEPHARFAVARGGDGRVAGFSLYFTKEFIDRNDPSHELYAVARDIAEAYGPDEKLVFYSQAAVANGASAVGLGKRMFQYVLREAIGEGAGFLFGRIVNDRLLEGTALEGQENRLDNIASRRAFTTIPGAVRVLERFVHAWELEAFLRDGRLPPGGIHNWQLFGLPLRPDRAVPADLPVPPGNFPPVI